MLYIALLMLFAKLFEEVAVHLRQPPTMGYIAAGVVLGSALLAWVQPADEKNIIYTNRGTFLILPDRLRRD